MGNYSSQDSIQKQSPLQKDLFIVQEKEDEHYGGEIKILKNRNHENELYALKQVNCLNKEQMQKQLVEGQDRQILSHPNLTQIIDTRVLEDDAFCGSIYVCQYLFEYHSNDITTDIQNRRQQKKPYNEVHILTMIDSIAKAIYYLGQNGIYHGDIKAQNIFVLPDRNYKIFDNLFFTGKTCYAKTLIGMEDQIYLAPELYSKYRDQVFDPFSSDKTLNQDKTEVFALGLVALQMALLCNNISKLYIESSESPLDYTKLEKGLRQKLELVQKRHSTELAIIIAQMLELNPKQRWSLDQTITNLQAFNPKIQSYMSQTKVLQSQHFNKLYGSSNSDFKEYLSENASLFSEKRAHQESKQIQQELYLSNKIKEEQYQISLRKSKQNQQLQQTPTVNNDSQTFLDNNSQDNSKIPEEEEEDNYKIQEQLYNIPQSIRKVDASTKQEFMQLNSSDQKRSQIYELIKPQKLDQSQQDNQQQKYKLANRSSQSNSNQQFSDSPILKVQNQQQQQIQQQEHNNSHQLFQSLEHVDKIVSEAIVNSQNTKQMFSQDRYNQESEIKELQESQENEAKPTASFRNQKPQYIQVEDQTTNQHIIDHDHDHEHQHNHNNFQNNIEQNFNNNLDNQNQEEKVKRSSNSQNQRNSVQKSIQQSDKSPISNTNLSQASNNPRKSLTQIRQEILSSQKKSIKNKDLIKSAMPISHQNFSETNSNYPPSQTNIQVSDNNKSPIQKRLIQSEYSKIVNNNNNNNNKIKNKLKNSTYQIRKNSQASLKQKLEKADSALKN